MEALNLYYQHFNILNAFILNSMQSNKTPKIRESFVSGPMAQSSDQDPFKTTTVESTRVLITLVSKLNLTLLRSNNISYRC